MSKKTNKKDVNDEVLEELANAAYDTLIEMGKTPGQINAMMQNEESMQQIVRLSLVAFSMAMGNESASLKTAD